MLKQGILLVRLSDNSNKLDALKNQGKNLAAQNLEKDQLEQNQKIAKAFQTHFKYCKIHFIRPQDTKSIIANKNNILTDVISGAEIDLSEIDDLYFTSYGYGHPADGFERYNRKGFQILHLEEGEIRNLGRDLFYTGVKQGMFSSSFSKSLQKTILKLNRRLESGSKYF